MYILQKHNDYEDDSNVQMIACSHDFDKLAEMKAGFVKLHENWLKLNQENQSKYREEWIKYTEENYQFWLRHKYAIGNPKHPDSLWVFVKFNNERMFAPSGICPEYLQRREPPKPAWEVTGQYPIELIELERLELIKNLSRCTDYTYHKYIDWESIDEPMPIFDYVSPVISMDNVGIHENLLEIIEVKEI